jgi:hypothetical protein
MSRRARAGRLATVVVMAGWVLSTGCARHSGDEVQKLGVLLYATPDGGEVRRMDLDNGAESRVARWNTEITRRTAGLGGEIAGAVLATMYVPGAAEKLVVVPLGRDTQPRILCDGRSPTVQRGGETLVYLLEGKSEDSLVYLAQTQIRSPGTADTLGRVRRIGQRGNPGWTYLESPVEMDTGEFAVVGADGALWGVSPQSKRWRQIGPRGSRPLFWLQRARILICWRPYSRPACWALDMDSGGMVPVPELEGLAGYATDGASDSALVCLPRRGGGSYETWDLRVYSWSTRTLGPAVIARLHVAGAGVWVKPQ